MAELSFVGDLEARMDKAVENTLSPTALLPSISSFCDYQVLFSIDEITLINALHFVKRSVYNRQK